MNSFLDMAPAAARVAAIGDARYPVPGIKLKELAYLIKRYWEVLAPLAARLQGEAAAEQDFLPQILALPDDIIAAIIAAGMGHAGSEKAEANAAGLSSGTQAQLLAEIIGETMPDGAVPFVESVAKLFLAIGREKSAEVASSKPSRKRSIT